MPDGIMLLMYLQFQSFMEELPGKSIGKEYTIANTQFTAYPVNAADTAKRVTAMQRQHN